MKYIISGNEIILDTTYIKSLNEFRNFVDSETQEFIKIYQKEIKSFDHMLEKVPGYASYFIALSLEFCISKLVENGILNYSIEMLLDEYYEPLELGFLDEFFEILQPYFDISLTQIEEQYVRNIQKEQRGRWSGGGFGIKGAIKGAMAAEALNFGTGLAYNIKNGILKFGESIKLEQMKNKIFHDRSIYRDILMLFSKYCMYSHDVYCELHPEIMSEKTDFNKNEAYAIYKNAETYISKNDPKYITLICEAIECYPFEVRFYNKLYDITGGSAELTKLVKNVGVLEEFVRHVMGSHLTEIPETIEEITSLIKELQQYQNTKKANSCGFDYNNRIRVLMAEKEHLEKRIRQQELEKEKIAQQEREKKQQEEEEKRIKMMESFTKISKYLDCENFKEARSCLNKASEFENDCWQKEWLEYRFAIKKDEEKKSIKEIIQRAQDENEKEMLIPLLEKEIKRLIDANNHNKKIDDILDALISIDDGNYKYWVWKCYASVNTAIANKVHIFMDTQKKYLQKAKESNGKQNVKTEITDYLCKKKQEHIQIIKNENIDIIKMKTNLTMQIKREQNYKEQHSWWLCFLGMVILDVISLPIIYFASKIVLGILLHFINTPLVSVIMLLLWIGISIGAIVMSYQCAFEIRSSKHFKETDARITDLENKIKKQQEIYDTNEQILDGLSKNYDEALQWVNENL